MTFLQRLINVDAKSWRCIDINATLYKRHVPAGMANRWIIYYKADQILLESQ